MKRNHSSYQAQSRQAPFVATLAIVLACFVLLASAAAGKVSVATYVRNGDHLLMHGTDYGATDSVVKLWFDEKSARRDEGSMSLILNRSKNMFFVVNHATKKYQEVPLPFDVVTMVPDYLKQDFARLWPGRALKGEIEATGERRHVASWGAQKAQVHLSSERGERRELSIWLSQDISDDPSAVFDLLQMIAQLKIRDGSWWSEAKHMGAGFPVLIDETYYLPYKTIHLDSAQLTEELVSVEEERAAAGVFDVPDGYTKDPMVLEVGGI